MKAKYQVGDFIYSEAIYGIILSFEINPKWYPVRYKHEKIIIYNVWCLDKLARYTTQLATEKFLKDFKTK